MRARSARSRRAPSGDPALRGNMIALLLVALALGVDNLAVSLGIGVSGVHGAMRGRVAVIFGLFEAGMPLLGMAAGRAVAGDLGRAAPGLGGGRAGARGGPPPLPVPWGHTPNP